MVKRRSFSLIIGIAVHFKESLDLVQKRFLRLVIDSSEVLRSLEHKMLEVVSKTCSLGWIVLSTHLYSNVGLDTRSFLVYAHIDLQSVVERIDLCSERVTFHSFILVLRT